MFAIIFVLYISKNKIVSYRTFITTKHQIMTSNIILIFISVLISVPFAYFMIKDNNEEYEELRKKRNHTKDPHLS